MINRRLWDNWMTIFLVTTFIRTSYNTHVDNIISLPIIRPVTLNDLVDGLKLSDLVSLRTRSTLETVCW